MKCGYDGDREGTLIAYLYDDIEPAARAEFQAHVAVCEPCRSELQALGGVRTTLARWNPPEPKSLADRSNQQSTITTQQSRWWKEIPAWAQVAAALLFLGVAAGLANLDVRYDANGLAIHTGWMKPAAANAAATPATPAEGIGIQSQAPASSASTADLAALERRLREEFRPVTATAAAGARPAASDAEILRKVQARIDETERRQQRELALRLAQAVTDFNAQRQADLRKIDSSLNGVQNSLGVEVLKQRQTLNYIMRVNQRQ
jgi:hypothetical protein